MSRLDTYKPKVWKGDDSKGASQSSSSSSTSTSSTATASQTSYLAVRGDRPLDAARVPFFKTSVVSSSSGSAYYESANTKVVCAVYGPTQSSRSEFSDQGSLSCNVRFAPFALESRRPNRSRVLPEEIQMAAALQEALSVSVQLNKFPKHELTLEVIVLERGGGELAAALSCASLALADSSVEMYDIVGAATTAFVKKAGCVVDPTKEELEHPDCLASVTVGYMPALRQVTFLRQAGRASAEQIADIIGAATTAAEDVAGHVRTRLTESLAKALAGNAATTAAVTAVAAAVKNAKSVKSEKGKGAAQT